MSSGEESLRLLGEGIAAYRKALEVYTRERFPGAWASLQRTLGFCLTERGERSSGVERLRLLGEAVTASREALKVYTREQSEWYWALTQRNLGEALRLQGEQSSGEDGMRLLGEAVTACREALKVFDPRKNHPWAVAQYNLCSALISQSKRSIGEERPRLLAEAITAHNEALKEYALYLPNLTKKEKLSAAEEEYLRMLAEIITARREALKAFTPEQLPQQWAATQYNLGEALRGQTWQSSEEARDRLRVEAVIAYREALKVYTPERFPREWTKTQRGLGRTLSSQGRQLNGEDDMRLLGEAVTAYREALKAIPDQEPRAWEDWAKTQYDLGATLALQGKRLSGEEGMRLLAEAVAAYREAIEAFSRQNWSLRSGYSGGPDWAKTHDYLGKTYLLLKEWKDAAVCFENALTAPNYEGHKGVYQSLASIYQERLFEYEKAFDLREEMLSRFPQDAYALAGFAETHFTTGRFPEFSHRIEPLLTNPEISASSKVALQMIEVANLLVLGNADQVPVALASLHKTISDQKADFRINWSFSGALNFINREERFVSYRPWLNRFFSVAREENRDALLKALREAQAQFPAVSGNHRR